MQVERYFMRDRAYGAWHRAGSISRYLGHKRAASLGMVDLDSCMFIEFQCDGKMPLCLVEVAFDIGQEKSASVLQNLARLAHLPAYTVLYHHADHPNPANANWMDIDQFRIKRIWPKPERGWRTLTPAEWAHALVQIRGWQLRRFLVQDAANDPNY